MIKHIVMWRLHEESDGQPKAVHATRIKQEFEALPAIIPQIRFMQAGVNIIPGEDASDLVLYSEFQNIEDLQSYQAHPEHQRIVKMLSVLRSEKRVVDYEV